MPEQEPAVGSLRQGDALRQVVAGLSALAVAAGALAWYFHDGGSGAAPAPPSGTAEGCCHASPLAQMLSALAVLLIVAALLRWAGRRLMQPPVVWEMLAGILLGPSLLGRFWPDTAAALIPDGTAAALSAIGQIGVILFMFVVGVHLDLSVLRHRTAQVMLIAPASVLVPFVLGAAFAVPLYAGLAGNGTSPLVFVLFMGMSMAVTAFPVLARILQDRGLSDSPLGHLALSCAAVNDAVAWCMLAVVVSVARSDLGAGVGTTVLCVAFVGFAVVVLRPLAVAWARRVEAQASNGEWGLGGVAIALLLCALVAERIGVHALFGAFVLGAVIPSGSALARRLTRSIQDVTLAFLLPAYFAYTGLRTEIGLIQGAGPWLLCALIIAVATLGKFGGTWMSARAVGMGWRDASMLGALMNTRGLMEIIILNIGMDLGVFSPQMFAMLVLMALVTTIATSPALTLLGRTSRTPAPPEPLLRPDAATH